MMVGSGDCFAHYVSRMVALRIYSERKKFRRSCFCVVFRALKRLITWLASDSEQSPKRPLKNPQLVTCAAMA